LPHCINQEVYLPETFWVSKMYAKIRLRSQEWDSWMSECVNPKTRAFSEKRMTGEHRETTIFYWLFEMATWPKSPCRHAGRACTNQNDTMSTAINQSTHDTRITWLVRCDAARPSVRWENILRDMDISKQFIMFIAC